MKPIAPPVIKKEIQAGPSLRFLGKQIERFSDLARLKDSLGNEKMLLVLKINRLDLKHVREHDTLAVPTIFDERISAYPSALDSAQDIAKLILISRRAQVFGAYAFGKLVRWGPASTGKKKTPTPDGLYAANWKKDLAISTVDPTWLLPWCVNIHNTEGISLHQFDLPGYPASHSCIRLLDEDAKWIFDWVDTWILTNDSHGVVAFGTPVIVFDEYPFGSEFLRKRILKNQLANFVSSNSLDSVLTLYKPIIIERQQQRHRILTVDTATPR